MVLTKSQVGIEVEKDNWLVLCGAECKSVTSLLTPSFELHTFPLTSTLLHLT